MRQLLLLTFLLTPSLHGETRTSWTASRIHGTPEPPPPYLLERVEPQLTFQKPVEIAPIPGANRLVVVEQNGILRSYVPGAAEREIFGNLKEFDSEIQQTYAITFHPKFAENRFTYVFAVQQTRGQKNRENGSRILRFKVTEGNAPRLDLTTGQVIFTWMAGGHNGGNLRFGPDGMLYLATGDADHPDPPDSLVTGQDIGDTLSSILRIDVDHPEEGRAYGIPKDNPFVNLPKARGEVWAYGLRNPWRLAFDPKSGELYTGDVGWELWEMIYRVRRGANFGWSLTEGGKQEVRPDRVKGPTPVLPPLVAHSHEEAASITGGEFYHGKRLPELSGAYLYADYQMGTFWSLRATGDTVTEHKELARSPLMPAGFGIDHEGELLVCDHNGGGIWRLAKNPEGGKPSTFPTKLSQTGLFTDAKSQTPQAGVVPYQVNAARWADHATSERWVALPGTAPVEAAAQSKGVVIKGLWTYPAGAVFAKTYSLEMKRGEAASSQKIETQLLHFDGNLWAAYTYKWNADQSDAELVGPKGEEATFEITEAGGEKSNQRWRYFSRAECLRCHTMWTGFTPGYTPAQLNRGDQSDRFHKLGLAPDRKDGLSDPHDASASLETRARSYLHANCATCHRYNGGGAVPVYLDIDTPLADAKLLDSRPVQGDLALPDARVVAPGDPCRSVLLYRMATAGRGHMPYLGGRMVDERGVLLLRDWIASLKDKPANPELAALKNGTPAALDSLLTTNGGALDVLLAVMDGSLPPAVKDAAIAKGAAVAEPMRRDLFERYLPEAQRRVVLGPGFDVEALLAREGDPQVGAKVFTTLCVSCHRVNGTGIDFGPDLSKIGPKWKRRVLLEHLTAPSQLIDPAWRLTTVELKNGEFRTGFVAAHDATGITLKMPGGLVEKISAGGYGQITSVPVSVMPEGLVQSMTAEEAAGLLAYLKSLQ